MYIHDSFSHAVCRLTQAIEPLFVVDVSSQLLNPALARLKQTHLVWIALIVANQHPAAGKTQQPLTQLQPGTIML